MVLYNSIVKDGARSMKINLERISAAIGTVISSKKGKQSAKKLKEDILLKMKEREDNPAILRAALVMCLEELAKDIKKEDLDDAIDLFLEELIAELFEELSEEDLLSIQGASYPDVNSNTNTISSDNPMYR